MVGLERSILPAIAEVEFHLATRSAILSFIVVFGVVKALTNYFAGRLGEIGSLAAVYPAVWGVGQLLTGGLSDRIGRWSIRLCSR